MHRPARHAWGVPGQKTSVGTDVERAERASDRNRPDLAPGIHFPHTERAVARSPEKASVAAEHDPADPTRTSGECARRAAVGDIPQPAPAPRAQGEPPAIGTHRDTIRGIDLATQGANFSPRSDFEDFDLILPAL